jgi:hypothetical protein
LADVETVKQYMPELCELGKIKKPHIRNIKNFEGNIFVFNPDFIRGIEAVGLQVFFSEIDIKDDLRREVEQFKSNYNECSIAAIHMRLGDFESNRIKFDYYEEKIKSAVKNKCIDKLLVCTDSSEAEKRIVEKFKDKIIINVKKYYPEKRNESISWKNNTIRSRDSVLCSVVDLYLLFNYKMVYYNSDSTFAHVAILISENKVVYNKKNIFRNVLIKLYEAVNEKIH